METPIDVSTGQSLSFAANGVPISGIILGSKVEATVAAIVVETETAMPDNAQLTLPDFPEIGGCWQAHPEKSRGGFTIVIKLPLSIVHFPTIGK